METIDKLLSELESAIATKITMSNSGYSDLFKTVVMGSLFVILLVFVFFTPWWVWVLGLASIAITGYVLYNNKCKTDFSDVSVILAALRKEINIKESANTDNVNIIKELEEKLKDSYYQLEKEKNRPVDIKKLSTSRYMFLLKELQLLDYVAVDFGEKHHKYVREEIAKSFRYCGLRFEDYSEEYADCYEIEINPDLDRVKCITRAVMDNSTNHVVLMGKVYLPKR